MPSTALRSSVLTKARRVVVKLGTQLLTHPTANRKGDGATADADGWINQDLLAGIAGQIRQLRDRGVEVTLVSSGAIGSGCALLGAKRRPRDLPHQQALAAVGQPQLMRYLQEAFGRNGIQIAQLLLTRGDFDDRSRFLNIRNCILKLHQLGCVPVANENDTVSIDELRFGDNDMLAALLTNLLRADALVLLTVVDGVLDESGQRIDLIENARESLRFDRQDTSLLGTGGIRSKIESASLVTDAGEIAVIANGREPDVLLRLLDGEALGTVFVPSAKKLNSRRRWIGMTRRPSGVIRIDAGAARALVGGRKSLLAGGIVGTEGKIGKGDVVILADPAGTEIGRGLSNYTDEEISQIAGCQSAQIPKILGRPGYAEVVHRDNLVISRLDA